MVKLISVFLSFVCYPALTYTDRWPEWEQRVFSGAGQNRQFDGESEEKKEDHLQSSSGVWVGADLCCHSVPGHHPEGEAGRAHTPAWEQDTGEAVDQELTKALDFLVRLQWLCEVI